MPWCFGKGRTASCMCVCVCACACVCIVENHIFSHLDIPVASLLPYLQFLPPPVQLLLQPPPGEILKTWTLPFSESCVASSHLYYKVQTPSPQGTLNLASLSVLPACGPCTTTAHSSQFSSARQAVSHYSSRSLFIPSSSSPEGCPFLWKSP